MSRRNPNDDLINLINQYKDYKDTENSVKKLSSPLGEKIKKIFNEKNITSFDTDKWTASVSIKPNSDFNEHKAIEILKEQVPEVYKKVVRTKEYIDEDALEKEIYNHVFDPSILSCCEEPKEPTIRLSVTKKKVK